MRARAMMSCVLLCWAVDASAQVFTPARTPDRAKERLAAEVVRADSEAEMAEAEPDRQAAKAKAAALRERLKAQSTTDTGGSFLTQAALQGLANDGDPEFSIQAAELYFNSTFRVYLRSTLSIDTGEEEEEDEGSESSESDEGEDDAAAALEERIKSALLDPYGGLLYLTTGAFRPVAAKPPVEGEKPRGLFFDGRAGVRAVQIDEKRSENNSVVPFATVSAGLVFQWPVWPKPTLSSDDDSVGDFVFGLTWVGNAVLDKSVSDVFKGDDPVLDRWTHTLALTAGISLKGMAKLTFTGNPWSSSSALGKRFSVGLAIVREE